MNKEQLQALLNQRYNVKNWEKIYGSIFPNVTLFSSPKEIPVTESWVKSFRQRGLVRLDGNQDVAIFEVVLQDGISVQSKRVGLRNLVAKLIDEYQNHGVLAVFDNGSPEYRFTFAAKETKVTREGVEKSETDSKRYTYILGETETCKTAAEQFIKLAEKGTGISLTDLRDAFSVEKLSKQFFNEYKEQYNHFVGYLASQPRILKSVFVDDEKKMRDFVKLLLGRLVFLQFVQKKKWLGVPAKNKDWHSGDVRFLVNAFNGFANKDKFYSDYLEELFFECLNNPNRKNELFELSGTKVPFLNGGLFENDNAKTKNLNFPATYFTGLFEFFGKYNFTIDENDPTEKEVGIDPEMLGSIFENLLEDNKDKGAFYTPKEIVHYMCQESLIEYLNTKVNENQDERICESIRHFITKRKTDEHILKLVSPLAIALREVKICDPAIGSGAFPMGMLMEIFHAVFELFNSNPKIVSKEWNMNGWQPNIVKSNIIQNSIYGVDIEKGAVDIARLRFWLSLIVDEEEPKALPNLDYKIVVGNSLVSKLGDDIIDIDWEVKVNSDAAKKLQQEIQNNLNKLFNTQKLFFDFNGKKKNLKAEIRNLKIDVLISQLQLDKYKYGNSSAQIGSLFEMTAKEKAADQERKQRLSSFDKTIQELQRLKSNPDLPLNFFDWKLDFPEVLNDSINLKPGFDILIANPPYDVYEGKKKAEIEGLLSFDIYHKCKGGKINAYELFLAKTDELIKNNGTNCQIFQNSFLADNSSKGVRNYYLENQKIINIDSFPERDDLKKRVFESAKMSVCILMSCKKIISDYKFVLRIHSDRTLNIYYTVEFNKSEIVSFDPVNVVIPSLQKEDKRIFIKYYKSENLEKYSEKFECIEGELNMTFHKDYMTSDKRKPLIVKGAQIQRYFVTEKPSQGQIEYVDKKRYLEDYSKSKKSLHHNEKRIALQGISGANDKVRIISTIIDENIFCANSCNYILKREDNLSVSIYTLLAVFNSQLTNWIFRKTSTNSNVNCYEVNNLKIPRNLNKFSKQLENIVKNILEMKSINKDTAALEQQIDNIVYRLYELKYDEVKVIDPEFPLSQKEYENISLE